MSMESAESLFSIPWYCDNKDCPHDWHLATYWVEWRQEDGEDVYEYTDDSYSDGDHQPVSKDEVPRQKEVERAWKDYYEWVADEGEDPLGEFFVLRSFHVPFEFEVEFKSKKGRFAVSRLKSFETGEEWTPPTEIELGVTQYLHLTHEDGVFYYSGPPEELCEILAKGDGRHNVYKNEVDEVRFRFKVKLRRENPNYKEELKEAAKKREPYGHYI